MAEQADLGAGVRVRRTAEDELVVTSERLRLPLEPPAGAAPGTAVEWADELWQVAGRGGGDGVEWWRLRRWSETVAVRRLVRLDARTVDGWGRDDAERQAVSRRLARIMPLLPVLGFAPARIQAAWRDRWGFPATTATRLSVAAELLLGAFGTVSLLVETFGGRPPVPSWLSWVMPIGPLLLLEGLVRLARHLPSDDPVGSVLGLPLELAVPAPAPRPPTAAAPIAVELDDHRLVLRSDECRSDWVPEGELRYRDRRWRLAAADRDGVAWRYRFEAVPDAEPDAEHRLSIARPARPAPADPVRAGPGLGLVATTVLTAFACFASAGFQRSWAARLQIGPRTLTVLGAAMELLGGFVNLHRPSVLAVPVLSLLNAVLVLEGLARLAAASVTGGPVASLLGLPFERVVRRWLGGRGVGGE